MNKTEVLRLLLDYANAAVKHYGIVNGLQRGSPNKAFVGEKQAMKKVAKALGVELTDEDIENSL